MSSSDVYPACPDYHGQTADELQKECENYIASFIHSEVVDWYNLAFVVCWCKKYT